jgi:hypothetical protein
MHVGAAGSGAWPIRLAGATGDFGASTLRSGSINDARNASVASTQATGEQLQRPVGSSPIDFTNATR